VKRQKAKFAEGKFFSDRSAGFWPKSLKAVRRVLRDKSRAAIERRLFLSPLSFVTIACRFSDFIIDLT